jgi:hypothetical protein
VAALIRFDISQVIILHLQQQTDEIVCQNLWNTVSNICVGEVQYRDNLVTQGLIPVITWYLSNATQLPNVCYTIHTMYNKEPFLPIRIMQPIIELIFRQLPTQTDDVVLSCIVKAINKMYIASEYRAMLNAVYPWLVQYIIKMAHVAVGPQTCGALMRTVEIFTCIDDMKEVFIQHDGIEMSAAMLTSTEIGIVKSAVVTLHNIASVPESFSRLTQPDVLHAILMQSKMNRVADIKKYLILILCVIFDSASSYSYRNAELVNAMISMGVLTHILMSITHPDVLLRRAIVNAIEAIITYPAVIETIESIDGLVYLQEIMHSPETSHAMADKIARIVHICERKDEEFEMADTVNVQDKSAVFYF